MLKIRKKIIESSFQNFEPWIFMVLQFDLKQGLKCLENKLVPQWISQKYSECHHRVVVELMLPIS
jgi:hypothetical protein